MMLTQCLFSRLTCLSFLIVVTFIICLTQEFTYILNLHSYVTTTNFIENRPPLLQFLANNILQRREIRERPLETFKGKKNIEDEWRHITNDIYAYSAFWDDRFYNESFVRIIAGARLTNDSLRLKCLFTNDSISATYSEVPSKYRVLIEHHNRSSKTIYVICPSTDQNRPNFVSLVSVDWNSSLILKRTWLKVRLIDEKLNPKQSDIGICVRPLFNYTNAFHVVEFISYYEALGVRRFTFYKHDCSEEVEILFKQLRRNGYDLELLPWNLPEKIHDMWALGQIASINDCILRHVSTSFYVIVVDLDEFMTPRHVMTMSQLLFSHDRIRNSFSSFIFRSCVFCLEYDEDLLPPIIPKFTTQTRVHRENMIYPYMIRTKYVVKPKHVIVAGVHRAWELMSGFEERFIPANQALVHHYRANLCIGKNKTLEKGEIDVMSRKYLNSLLRSKAIEIWQDLFNGHNFRRTS